MSESLHRHYVKRGTSLGMEVPAIAEYHSGPFGIACILADPGGTFTAGSGAQKTFQIGLRNPDPTARFLLTMIKQTGFALSAYLPLNALAGFNMRPNKTNLRKSAELNSEMISKSGVQSVVLGGALARQSRHFLNLNDDVAVFEMPHPSARGRGMARRQGFDGALQIQEAFEQAKRHLLKLTNDEERAPRHPSRDRETISNKCRKRRYEAQHAMPLTLYSNYVNSAGERVRIAMALKNIDYAYVSVTEIGRAAYREINPQGLMPALDIDGRIIQQATAILEWMEEMHPDPPLLPSDPVTRAQARGFAQHIVSEMHAIDVIRVRQFLKNDLDLDDAKIDKWQEHWFHKGFAALEELLRRRETPWRYSFSDMPGWADLHLIPQVRKGLTRFNVDMTAYPLINSVYKACDDQPAFIAARPENQPDWPGQIIEPAIPLE